jgi:2-keto-3-deoxy-L-arabinonate dehydratase
MSSTNSELLHGVLPVLQTPFTAEGEIDRDTLAREIDWVFEVGADGVVVAMVSEVLRLGYHGRKQLAAELCQLVAERGYTVISVGAESTAEAVEFARHAEEIGASAMMAIPPVATSLGAAASLDYFSSIAASVSIPLVVQDASNYVGASIDLGVYMELLKKFGSDRIFFKPEASPICALVALQIQGGLDGFLAIEKYLLKKRGLFPNTLQIQPVGWQLDAETQAEVDRLFARLQAAL